MRRHTTSLLTLAGSTALLGGCYSPSAMSDPFSRDSFIRASLTPELMTLHQRPVDVDNQFAIMANENWRMFWSDLARATYTDRPSRLTPEPVPR